MDLFSKYMYCFRILLFVMNLFFFVLFEQDHWADSCIWLEVKKRYCEKSPVVPQNGCYCTITELDKTDNWTVGVHPDLSRVNCAATN